jgi:hypothetical protein
VLAAGLVAAACTTALTVPARPAAAATCDPLSGCQIVAPNDILCWEGQLCPMRLNFTLPVTGPILLTVSTQPLSALPGQDYAPFTHRVITIVPGAHPEIPVQLLHDAVAEPVEALRVTIDSAAGAVISRPSAIITINDVRPG